MCSNGVGPNPQIAVDIRLTRDLAIGLAVVAPHAAGPNEWPETLAYENALGSTAHQPASSRYLLVSSDAVIVYPTLSVAYAPTRNLAFGAGFVWGVASADVTNFAVISNTVDFSGDTKAELKVKDLFIPGVVLGALWTPSPYLDLGAWFKYQAPVDGTGDLHLESPYFSSTGNPDPSCEKGAAGDCSVLDKPGAGHVKFAIPMEARIGTRLHVPRKGAVAPSWANRAGARVRDPMSEDLFDIELDVTWAHNSAVDKTEVRFPSGKDAITFGGVGVVPANGDIPRHFKDVVGVRLGGDYVAVPSRLSLRGGGWIESAGVDAKYLNLDFDAAAKFGLSLGVTVRLGPVDVSAAYQHTFFATLDNGGDGGVHALSGNATLGYRSRNAVNGGSLAESMNEVALGGTLRW